MGDSKRGLPSEETAPEPTKDNLARNLNPRQSETFSQALFYCRQGWPIIPLQPGGKEPLADLIAPNRDGVRSWKPYADRPPSEVEVRDWLERYPELNLGLITGQASGLVVLDVDSPKELPKGVPGYGLPPTAVVKTGRGFHYWYKHDGPLRGRKFPFGDVKADGGYVVIPPSVHPSGERYTFVDTLTPGELADLPEWLADPQAPTPPKTAKGKGVATKSTLLCYTPESKDLERPADWAEKVEAAKAKTPKGREMLALSMIPEVAFEVLKLCGCEVTELGKKFLCPLPDHDESKPSVALWQNSPTEPIMLADFHEREGTFWWPLPDVFAAVTTGKTWKLTAAERVVWWIRALAEAGLVDLPTVSARSWPQDAPPAAEKLLHGFYYLLRVQDLYDPGSAGLGAPFSWSFAARWCGIGSLSTVSKGMKWVLGKGYLRPTSRGTKVGEGGPRRATFFTLAQPKER